MDYNKANLLFWIALFAMMAVFAVSSDYKDAQIKIAKINAEAKCGTSTGVEKQ